jgi:hypothetical protein
MADAKRFEFDEEIEYEVDDVVDVTITCNGHTHKYIYPADEEEKMRDIVFDQVETGRLHPYVGLMALLAMGEQE